MMASEDVCRWVGPDDGVHYEVERYPSADGGELYRSNASYEEALRRILELEERVRDLIGH